MNIIFHFHPFSYPSNPVCIEIRIKGCWVKKKETSRCSPALVRMCCPCASTHTRSSAPSTAPSWSPSGLVLRSMDHVQNWPILSTKIKHEEIIKSLDICVTVPLPSNCDKHCGCKGIKNGLNINIHYITVLICFEWSLNISGEGFLNNIILSKPRITMDLIISSICFPLHSTVSLHSFKFPGGNKSIRLEVD